MTVTAHQPNQRSDLKQKTGKQRGGPGKLGRASPKEARGALLLWPPQLSEEGCQWCGLTGMPSVVTLGTQGVDSGWALFKL